MTKSVAQQADDNRKALQAYSDIYQNYLSVAMEKAALFAEGQAKKRTPVDTGLLRASITHAQYKVPNGVQAVIGTVTEYAPFVEFGTSRQTAQPFLEPAVNENKIAIQNIIYSELKKASK